MINQTDLKSLLRYDPDKGSFTWIAKRRSGIPSHRMAGCIHSKGYVHIVVMGKQYKAHRLAEYMRVKSCRHEGYVPC